MAGPSLNAKGIAAWVALVTALSGAVELRVKVASIADDVAKVEHRLDKIEQKLEDRYASTDP